MGKANKAIIVVLSQSLGLRRQQIELLTQLNRGAQRFLIRGVAG